MDSITKLLFDFDKLPSKFVLCVCFLSGIILFAPVDFLAKVRLHDFNTSYGHWVGVAFLSSVAFLAVSLVTYITNLCRRQVAKIKEREQQTAHHEKLEADIRMHLQRLDPSEQCVLREFFIVGSTANLPMDQPAVVGLQDKQLIRLAQPSTGGYILKGYLELPFMLTDGVRAIIETTPSLIGMPQSTNGKLTEHQWDQMLDARPLWIRRNFRY